MKETNMENSHPKGDLRGTRQKQERGRKQKLMVAECECPQYA
jgi:hypothetical protein